MNKTILIIYAGEDPNGSTATLAKWIQQGVELVEGVTTRSKPMHFELAAGETITGLITATALVYPDKKLTSVKVKSITKRMKERSFAASVNRDVIMECEKLGITIDEFAQISLGAMCKISDQLGL